MNEGTPATLPIFPLAIVVLFPKLRVPLYIFEPRYRQMTRDALEGDRRIGMVTVKPDHLAETSGNPPIFSTGCEGKIIHSEALPDGGYNIVLLGTSRFQIQREQLPADERLYRVADVELVSDEPARDSSEARDLIIELLEELLQHSESGTKRSQASNALFEATDDELFANSLAQSLSFSASEKQGLIECGGVDDRLQQVLALLQFRLAAIRSGQSGTAHIH